MVINVATNFVENAKPGMTLLVIVIFNHTILKMPKNADMYFMTRKQQRIISRLRS